MEDINTQIVPLSIHLCHDQVERVRRAASQEVTTLYPKSIRIAETDMYLLTSFVCYSIVGWLGSSAIDSG